MSVIDSVPCNPFQRAGRSGVTMETAPAVLRRTGAAECKSAIDALGKSDQAMEFLKLHYRHCKPILALEGASALPRVRAFAAIARPQRGPGLLVVDGQD